MFSPILLLIGVMLPGLSYACNYYSWYAYSNYNLCTGQLCYMYYDTCESGCCSGSYCQQEDACTLDIIVEIVSSVVGCIFCCAIIVAIVVIRNRRLQQMQQDMQNQQQIIVAQQQQPMLVTGPGVYQAPGAPVMMGQAYPGQVQAAPVMMAQPQPVVVAQPQTTVVMAQPVAPVQQY